MYVFAGCKDGSIGVLEIGKGERERFSKQVAVIQGKNKIRQLSYTHSCKQILAGDDEGNITVWDAIKCTPLYVLAAHTKAITKIQWVVNESIIMTASRDRNCYIWRFEIDKKKLQQSSASQQQPTQISVEEPSRQALLGWHK